RGVAALRRQREPDVGLREVLCYAVTALMEDGEVKLAVDQAPLCGPREPAGGRGVVGPLASSEQHGQVVHGTDVPLLGGAAIPHFCALPIDVDADAALKGERQTKLRPC